MGVQGFSFGLVLGLPGARRTRRGSCKPERWFTRVGQQSWRWCLGRCPKGSSASLITPYWPGGTQNAVLISNIKVDSIFFFQCYSAGSIVAFVVRATWKINGLLVLLPLWFSSWRRVRGVCSPCAGAHASLSALAAPAWALSLGFTQ